MNTVIMIVAIILFAVIPSFKDRVIPVKKLLITPAIFSFLLYQSITESFYIDTVAIIFLTAGLIVGVVTGIILRSRTPVKADKQLQLIWLPGTYLNLVMFMLIFSVHFVIGYMQSVHPEMFASDNINEQCLLFFLACFSSTSIGASSCLYYKYCTSSRTIQ